MTIAERFWCKVARKTSIECWLWKAGLGIKGYGRFWNGKTRYAHRIAFELWWGVVLPSWLQVCHDCPGGDNRLCCNPNHLFISDAKGHGADKAAKKQMSHGPQHAKRIREAIARSRESQARQGH